MADPEVLLSELSDDELDAHVAAAWEACNAAQAVAAAGTLEQGRRRLVAALPDGARLVTFAVDEWDNGMFLEFDRVLDADGADLGAFCDLRSPDSESDEVLETLSADLTDLWGIQVDAFDLTFGQPAALPG